jgi:hypothetical protein
MSGISKANNLPCTSTRPHVLAWLSGWLSFPPRGKLPCTWSCVKYKYKWNYKLYKCTSAEAGTPERSVFHRPHTWCLQPDRVQGPSIAESQAWKCRRVGRCCSGTVMHRCWDFFYFLLCSGINYRIKKKDIRNALKEADWKLMCAWLLGICKLILTYYYLGGNYTNNTWTRWPLYGV